MTEVATKKCTKCGGVKPPTPEFFSRSRRNASGLQEWCKDCAKAYAVWYQETHRADLAERGRAYRETHKAERRATGKRYRETHKDEYKSYRESRKAARAAEGRRYRETHKAERRATHKRYADSHKLEARRYREAHKAERNARELLRRATDPSANLRSLLRKRLLKVLRGTAKRERSTELLGCSWEELRKHIEAQFKPGMTWENHGNRGWHLDHILPCALFDLTDPTEQKICFHYTNLQPLWAAENLAKADKVIRPARQAA